MEGARSDGPPPEGLFGSGTMPAVFAEAGMAYAAKYGTTLEQFAQVAVKNHHHATMNPKAMYRRDTPLQEVLASEMIAYPLTKLMCSANVDGSAAAVLVSEKKARELGVLGRAVRVRGSALQSDPYESRNPVMFDANSVTRLAATNAYEMAGVGPDEIDLVELHDCFATAEILHYENLNLCGEGEAGALIDSGATAAGRAHPGQRLGRVAVQGPPDRRHRHRQHRRDRHPLARRSRPPPGRGGAARHDSRARLRLLVRGPHPREGLRRDRGRASTIRLAAPGEGRRPSRSQRGSARSIEARMPCMSGPNGSCPSARPVPTARATPDQTGSSWLGAM